jgi:hypothetical protein
MGRVAQWLARLGEHSHISATVTVTAMLVAGVLAKLDNASWGLYVIIALCLFHAALALARYLTRSAPEPGE